jgi:hypothetical protein
MIKAYFKSLLGLGLLSCLAATASAQTLSPFQSAYRPLGLSIVSKVYLDSTDTTSTSEYSNNATWTAYIQKMLPETVAFTGIGLNQLNPQQLYFLFSYTPRVYFIYEGAGYIDALGATIATVSTPTNKPTTGTSYTLFPDQHWSMGPWASGSGVRSTSEPLMPGDFVELPTINAGQQLAFFIMSNMNSSTGVPEYTFYNGASNNPDNFQHMVAFFPDNSQFIIIGFEDMYGGGDKDCNDLMFVVDVGPNNAAAWRAPSSMPK